MAKSMQDMVRGAVSEMRRYYSRKVIDVLVRVTRHSLEALMRRFCVLGEFKRHFQDYCQNEIDIPKNISNFSG